MPVIKSAIKKLKQDKKRQKENDAARNIVLRSVKVAQKTASEKNVSAAFSAIDKAVKKNLMHKNKAARMKSSLAKLTGPKKTAPVKGEAALVKPAAKAVKKPAVKKSVPSPKKVK